MTTLLRRALLTVPPLVLAAVLEHPNDEDKTIYQSVRPVVDDWMRLAGFGIRAPKNPLLGYDLAGRVESVGANAGLFDPGTRSSGRVVAPSPSTLSHAVIVWRRSRTT
jgi:hypothetical protein